ncbi:hypothetical protein CHQ57_08395 [Aeromonas salmonicida]|nr:hypothetical protein CHQ57_08395 [Aeromonas salmonicida]
MMNPFSWLQMTNMISYQGLVRTFPSGSPPARPPGDWRRRGRLPGRAWNAVIHAIPRFIPSGFTSNIKGAQHD